MTRLTERRHGVVELTPAGRFVLHRHLSDEHGVEMAIAAPVTLTEFDQPHPAVELVLTTIARFHPDEQIAGAAGAVYGKHDRDLR